MPAYLYEHVVGFEETSVVGNVYFTNYFLWQGHCREMFLRERAPLVLPLLERREIQFLTRSASCRYEGDAGFAALDRVRIEMRLARFRGGRMTLEFTYLDGEHPDRVVATGAQEIACKAQRDGSWIPEPFPAPLVEALLEFADGDELAAALHEALEHHRSRSK